MNPNPSLSDEVVNIPNTSMMGLTYNPTFGNIGFQIQPSVTGEVSNTFGTIPYLSLEGLIYQQQIQAQVTPTSILPGQNTGQQNISGTLTATNANTGAIQVAISGGGTTGNSTSSATGTF